jgi:hypothetical protein
MDTIKHKSLARSAYTQQLHANDAAGGSTMQFFIQQFFIQQPGSYP